MSLIICLTISALFGSVGGVVASDLPACPSSGYFDNCFGTYTFADDDKYVGEWKDDKYNGQGTYTFASGDKYVGEYKNGERNGQGIYTHANGDIYFGEYRNGEKNGQGTYTYVVGEKYVGEFKDDKYNGQGTYTYADGDKYVGKWKDDNYSGQGTYTFADGTKEVGEFKDGKLNGYAVQYSFDGSILKEGIWKDDEFQYAQNNPSSNSDETSSSTLPSCPTDSGVRWHDCFGAYTFGSDSDWAGDKYVGEWKDNKLYGQGTYTYANGNKYVGGYKDNQRHGQGTYTFGPNSEWLGDEYFGEYKNDQYHGQGIYTYANGEKYVGEFKDGLFNGQGTFTWGPNSEWAGDKYVGDFKDDKKHGRGTYTWANGDKYVGEFKDDASNGQGTYTFADGSFKEGIWKDWEFQYAQNNPSLNSDETSSSTLPSCPSDISVRWHNCFGAYTYDSDSDWAGDKYVGEWKDNKLYGQGTYTYANGNKYVGGYKDNQRHGQGTYTWIDGDKYVGEYKDGKQNGQGTYTFGPNSEWAGDKYVGGFVDDQIHGQGTYTHAGGNKYVGEFKDNKKHGRGIYTIIDSGSYGDRHEYVGEFRDDNFNGEGTYTEYLNGKIVSKTEGIWKDDEFQYAQKNPSLVPKVNTPAQDDEIISASSGSGFAVTSDGYVITNHHVIDGCEKVMVHTKGKELPVTVVTYDSQNDLALLKGDFNPPTVFPLSNTRPELLQDIYVAGFPFGDMFSTSVKVTKGIISSLTGLGNNFSNFQIDAALQSGNSGGPILDDLGNVVGVAVAKLDAKYMFEELGIIPEDTNFGIKSNVVRSILESNDVETPSANQSEISKSKLGKMISSGTYYVSCWMTTAQIEKMKTKKVFFSNLD